MFPALLAALLLGQVPSRDTGAPGRPAPSQPTRSATNLAPDRPTKDATATRASEPGASPLSALEVRRIQAEIALAEAQAALGDNRLQEARAHLEEAERLGASAGQVAVWRAALLTRLGRWAEAAQSLEAALAARPQDPRLLAWIARLEMAAGKDIWAMRHLAALVELRPKDCPARLLLARVLLRLEEWADAREVLEEAARLPKGSCPTREIRALTAWADYHLGRIRRARRNTVLARGHRLTRALEAALVADMAGSPNRLTFRYSVRTGLDTNPTLGPEPVPGWTSADQAALAMVGSLSLAWHPVARTRHLLALQAGGSFSVFGSPWDEEASQRAASFDTFQLFAAGEWWYRRLAAAGLESLGLGYRTDLLLLKGGPGIPGEPDLFAYSEAHRLRAGWQRRQDAGTWDVTAELRYEAFRDLDRDGPGLGLSSGLMRSLRAGRLKLYLRGKFDWHHARWAAWSWLGVGAWLAASWLGPWKLDVTAWAAYDWRLHYDSRNAFEAATNSWSLPTDTLRQDHLVTLSASVGRRLDARGRLRMDMSCRYLHSESTAEFFTYSRLVVLAGLGGSLSL